MYEIAERAQWSGRRTSVSVGISALLPRRHSPRLLGGERMTARYNRFLRIVTGALGFGGLAAVACDSYGVFSSFALWRLFLSIMALAGSAMFLFYAFHREPQWPTPGLGGSRGTAPAPVTWPPSTKPPALSAAAAEPIPREPELSEYQGASAPNPPLQRTPDSRSVSKPDTSGPAPLS